MEHARSKGFAFLAIAVYGVLLWWVRVLPDPATAAVGIGNLDQHIEHLPMARYGFAALRAGNWPLWNPYQLAGMPFFAVPQTALLYPGVLVLRCAFPDGHDWPPSFQALPLSTILSHTIRLSRDALAAANRRGAPPGAWKAGIGLCGALRRLGVESGGGG